MENEQLDSVARPLECPSCAREVEAVSDGEATNFLCRGCGSCWNLELGWLRPVDPANCPGCAARPACLSGRDPRSRAPQQGTPFTAA